MRGGVLLLDALGLAFGGNTTFIIQKPEEWWSPSRKTTSSTEQRCPADPMFLPGRCGAGLCAASVCVPLEAQGGRERGGGGPATDLEVRPVGTWQCYLTSRKNFTNGRHSGGSRCWACPSCLNVWHTYLQSPITTLPPVYAHAHADTGMQHLRKHNV